MGPKDYAKPAARPAATRTSQSSKENQSGQSSKQAGSNAGKKSRSALRDIHPNTLPLTRENVEKCSIENMLGLWPSVVAQHVYEKSKV